MKKYLSNSNILLLSSSFLVIHLLTLCSAQNCSSHTFSNNNIYKSCNSLPVLNSVLHWNYHSNNNTIDIAYRQTGATTSNWIVWSLNPTGGRMIGAQCLVAFQNSNGKIQAYTSPVSTYSTSLSESPLTFEVPNIAAEYVNNEMIIYATILLPTGKTSFRHVWQIGGVSGNRLKEHQTSGPYMRSFANIDFASTKVSTSTPGTSTGGSSGGDGDDSDENLNNSNGGDSSEGSADRSRNLHGLLNAVSWGVLMPMGAMMARYLKVFKSANPAWFYLHVTCQTSAYIVGVIGWITGLRLDGESEGGEQETHKNIGFTLFALGTLQVFALLLRPKPDHKYRFYWNIYHHLTGYTVIVLSIINIFVGLELLNPGGSWKRIYIGIIMILGACAVVLELYTWYIVLRRKKLSAAASDRYPMHVYSAANGSFGA